MKTTQTPVSTRYAIRIRRGGWAVTTLTVNGTEKTVRRFDTEREALAWAAKAEGIK